MSPYQFSETPGPQHESSQKHNVPALIHPFHSRDKVCSRTIDSGTRGLIKFVQGHIVSGRPITPPYLHPFQTADFLLLHCHVHNLWILFTEPGRYISAADSYKHFPVTCTSKLQLLVKKQSAVIIIKHNHEENPHCRIVTLII